MAKIPVFLQVAILAVVFLLSTQPTTATPYQITRRYQGANFFQGFNFITSDPSGGYVSYQPRSAAFAQGLVRASSSGAYIGVDHTSVTTGPRRSVRIESIATYTKGLFIGDFAHMPSSTCGLWPSFWMYGAPWPQMGEIDIIEGVNRMNHNRMTAHTSSGCTIAGANSNAQLITNNCNEGDAHTGCSFKAKSGVSYGSPFNARGGGVYAMQWTDQWISIWFFDRQSIPANIKNEHPDPSTWGKPASMFWGGCNVNNHFQNMRLTLNIDFCGPWADGTWADFSCPSLAPTCESHVQNHPRAFSQAFWHVNYIKVFHQATSNHRMLNAAVPANWTSVTPLASITSVYLPDNAMGATVPAKTDTAAPPVPPPASLTSVSSAPTASVAARRFVA